MIRRHIISRTCSSLQRRFKRYPTGMQDAKARLHNLAAIMDDTTHQHVEYPYLVSIVRWFGRSITAIGIWTNLGIVSVDKAIIRSWTRYRMLLLISYRGVLISLRARSSCADYIVHYYDLIPFHIPISCFKTLSSSPPICYRQYLIPRLIPSNAAEGNNSSYRTPLQKKLKVLLEACSIVPNLEIHSRVSRK